MRIAFLNTSRDTLRTCRAAQKGLADRGHDVVLLDNDTCSTRGSWFGAALRLKRALREHGAEVVFVSTNREHFLAAVARFLGSHAQVVRRVPAGNQLHFDSNGRWALRFAKTVFLFTSQGDERSIILPKRAVGSVVADLGIDASSYPETMASESSQDNPYIICVCDMDNARKRGAKAIRTIAMLAPRHPDLQLAMVGSGSDNDDVRMQAAALNILHMVHFLGERDDQQSLMQNAKLGWVVADGDSGGFGVLDLMMLGVPVIAIEDTVAERYIAHQITGVLLPEDDEPLTASTVAGLISSDEQRAGMGEAARARAAREFPATKMIDGFERAAQYAVERGVRKH